MNIRTTRSHATFSASFILPEVDGPLPPGTYDIDTDEEAIEGNERTVYLRTATLIHIRRFGMTRSVMIDPSGLTAALLREASQIG